MSGRGWVGNTFYGDLDSWRIELGQLRVERDEALAELHRIRTALVNWQQNDSGETDDGGFLMRDWSLYDLIPADDWGIEVPS